VRYLESGNDTLVFMFNHATSRAQSEVSMRLPAGTYSATDLLEGRPQRVTRTEDGLRLEADLAPSAMSVLRVTRQ